MASPKVLDGYPQPWGNKKISVFYHTGPSSYVQMVTAAQVITGDLVTDTEAGGKYIEHMESSGLCDNGQYWVDAVPGGGNPSQAAPNGGTIGAPQRSWRLLWTVRATGAEVGAGVDLSGRTVRLMAILSK
jgi:hypothetical protein